MRLRLISLTKERVLSSTIQFKSDVDVELIQSMGGDHMVVAAAKVSTCGDDALAFAKDENAEGNFGLINYLMKHRHGTPFEHSALTFFVRAPIFVWREWQRHRIGFSYNEESARYAVLKPVFYIPDIHRPMMKIEGWKPGRPKFKTLAEHFGASMDDKYVPGDGSPGDRMVLFYNDMTCDMAEGYKSEYARYERQLARGIDPGLARDCLPVGIYSGCWVTCNPRSLMAFLSLRTHDPEATQVSYPLWEIELAARACEKCLEAGWPLTYKAFCENGRVGP